MQKEDIALQAFAAEVFKRDPELYEASMAAVRKFVETRKRHWLARSKAGEIEALDTANAVVGMMLLFGADDIRDVPDVAELKMPGTRFLV